MKIGAGILFLADDGTVLLLQRTGGDHAGQWSVPGGYTEPADNDEPFATATRETLEETGYFPTNFEITDEFESGEPHVAFVTFLVAIPTPEKHNFQLNQKLSAEHSHAAWFALDNLLKNSNHKTLHPGIQKLLNHMKVKA